MPTHGPWLTPASVGTTTSPTPAGVLTRIQSGPDGLPPETFASVCEKTTGSGVSGDPATSITIALGGSSIRQINVAQELLQLDWAAVAAGMSLFYLGPVPPGASVEYEQPGGGASDLPDNDDPATLLSATITFGLTANRSVGTSATHLTVMTPEIRDVGTSVVATIPGASLAGLTLLGSTPAAAALDTAVTISGSLSAAAIQPPDGVSHSRHWWNLVLHHHEAITHAAPTTGTAGGADESWGSTISSPSSITITMTYQPPRYRFVYAVVPQLRQFPRDDFLGGAPRQGHDSTSVQASARQGWKATYR